MTLPPKYMAAAGRRPANACPECGEPVPPEHHDDIDEDVDPRVLCRNCQDRIWPGERERTAARYAAYLVRYRAWEAEERARRMGAANG